MQDNAKKVSKRLRSKPRHPAQLAADVVEGVIATSGDRYLETRHHALPWWQLSLLDVKAFLVVVASVIFSLVALCCVVMMKLLQAGWNSVWRVEFGRKNAKGKTA